jgi:hypothetical protein
MPSKFKKTVAKPQRAVAPMEMLNQLTPSSI